MNQMLSLSLSAPTEAAMQQPNTCYLFHIHPGFGKKWINRAILPRSKTLRVNGSARCPPWFKPSCASRPLNHSSVVWWILMWGGISWAWFGLPSFVLLIYVIYSFYIMIIVVVFAIIIIIAIIIITINFVKLLQNIILSFLVYDFTVFYLYSEVFHI